MIRLPPVTDTRSGGTDRVGNGGPELGSSTRRSGPPLPTPRAAAAQRFARSGIISVTVCDTLTKAFGEQTNGQCVEAHALAFGALGEAPMQ